MSVICNECQSGWADFDASASSECERCQPGTFSDVSATECTSCGSGKADTDLNPATACRQCEHGTYSPLGSTECVVCASGYADLDLDPASACETCGVGVISEAGLTECPLIYCSRFSVQHGSVSGSLLFRDENGRTYPNNSASIVTCDVGFSLSTTVVEKHAQRQCTVNSTWDVPAPKCVPINCTLAPNCAALLRTGCDDTMHTCGPCLPGYASMLAEGDGNDQCGILALVFNASVAITGIPPRLGEYTAAIEAAAFNGSHGSVAHAEIIRYVQVVHQDVWGLPGTPGDYMVPGPSTAWGAPAHQIEEALKLMIGQPDSSVTVTAVAAIPDRRRRRQLIDATYVSVSYTIVSTSDVSDVVSHYSNVSFLEALGLVNGPISIHNSTTDLTAAGPLAIDSSSLLVASEPMIVTEVQYVLTVRVANAAVAAPVLDAVSEILQNVTALSRFFDESSNRNFSIHRLELLSAGLVHLPHPPMPPPPPCGTLGIKCVTTGIESQYVILTFAGVACLWCMCGLCQATSDKLVAKHQRKVHVEPYPSANHAEEILRKKRRQAEQIFKAMRDHIDAAQLDSLKWRVGEHAIVDHFVELAYDDCIEFQTIVVERSGKLPAITMHLQPLQSSTIDMLIKQLEELNLDTRNLQRPAPCWKAAARKHRYCTYCAFCMLSSIDTGLHCLCAYVLAHEGQTDDGINKLFGAAYLSLLVRTGLSAASAVYTGWYLHEVGLEADSDMHLTQTLLNYHRTRRRSHHERIEEVKKLVSTEVGTLKAVAHWGTKSKLRPQSAPVGQIFHDFALKTAPLPTIRDSEINMGVRQDSTSEDDSDDQPALNIADRLKGGRGSQRPQSAGQVSVAAHAPAAGLQRPRPQSAAADALMRTSACNPKSSTQRAHPAAVLQIARPHSAGYVTSGRPGSAAPLLVSQYPPRAPVGSTHPHTRPATAAPERVSAAAVLRKADRPKTASDHLHPSKLSGEAAAAAVPLGANQQKRLATYFPDSTSSQRPQSASAALVGLQAQLTTYFEETPAAARRLFAGKQRRIQSAGPSRSVSNLPEKRPEKRPENSSTVVGLANAAGEAGSVCHAHADVSLPAEIVPHKRPVSAPLTLFHDAPRQAVVQINVEASKQMRSIQTHAAAVDQEQRAARKRTQKLQDAADLVSLRLEHLKKVEQQLDNQRTRLADARLDSQAAAKEEDQLDLAQAKPRPSKLQPIAETQQQTRLVQLKRPKSAAGVLMTLGASTEPGALDAGNDHSSTSSEHYEDENSSGEDEGESDEDNLQHETNRQKSVRFKSGLRQRWQEFWRSHGLWSGIRIGLRGVGLVLICLLNPFALAAALCVYRKHEAPTPVPLAAVYNFWVILSDVPMAYVLLDYSLRRGMLTVTSVLDGGGGSISSRIAAADEEGAPWLAIKFQRPEIDTPADMVVYATMIWTAANLCLHLGARWMFCARCCCAGLSCKRSMHKLCERCSPKTRATSTGEELEARARAYVTAGTHEHHLEALAEATGEWQQTLALHGSTGVHRSRPRSARPRSGGTHHEVDVLLERPRSATVLRAVNAPPSAPAHRHNGKAGGTDKTAASGVASVPHEVAKFEVVRPHPKSAAPLPALHSLRESSHGEDAGHVNQSRW